MEKDVVRPEQEYPVPLPEPMETVLKVRGARAQGKVGEGCRETGTGESGSVARAHGDSA